MAQVKPQWFMPYKPQATTWTNDDQVLQWHAAFIGLDELNKSEVWKKERYTL